MSTKEVKTVFYGPRDTAEILGVSRRTVYKLIASGELPHIRIGKLIRINVADLRALSYDINAPK